MRLFNRDFHLSLWTIFLSIFLSACVEPHQDTDNQIVVIGNGANWSKTLVVDIATSEHKESFVMTSKGLSPLSERLKGEPASNASSNSSQPLFLEWIAPHKETSFILKADHLNPTDQVREQQLYESSVRGTQRRSDLEDVPFSTKIKPLFLSDNSVIFVDENNELFWRNASLQSKWIMSGVNDLISDGYQTVFYRKNEAWYSINLLDLLESDAVLSSHKIFNRGFLFQTLDLSVYAAAFEGDKQDFYRLKPQMLHQWSVQLKSFVPSWIEPSGEKFDNLDVANAFSGPEAFFVRERALRSPSTNLRVLSFSPKGLAILPSQSATPSSEIVAGKNVAFIVSRSKVEIEGIEMCRQGNALRWTCHPIEDLPGSLIRLVVANYDEVFALGAKNIYRLLGEKNPRFVSVPGFELENLADLRYLSVPTASKTRSPNPSSR